MATSIVAYVDMLNDLVKSQRSDIEILALSPDTGLDDVYTLELRASEGTAKLAITWEAMISAYNNVPYRNAQFKEALTKAVRDFTSPSGAGRHSYVISTRGLRVEETPSDSQTLRALAGLEEAVKIGEEFVNKLKKSAT